MPTRTYIRDLQPSQWVEGVYAIYNCQLGRTKSEKPYIKCLLADNAAVNGRAAPPPRCGDASGPPVSVSADLAAPWSAEDRATLGAFVAGAGMPYPDFTASGERVWDRALSDEELHRIRRWIEAGAVVTECGACAP